MWYSSLCNWHPPSSCPPLLEVEGCMRPMAANKVVLLTSPKYSHPKPLLSRQQPVPIKPFRCNTYGLLRKCHKQKTYGKTKSFRCNTYKKPGSGSCPLDAPHARFGCGQEPECATLCGTNPPCTRERGLRTLPSTPTNRTQRAWPFGKPRCFPSSS